MQSNMNKFQDVNRETLMKHTLSKDNGCTQLGDVASLCFDPEEGQFHPYEDPSSSKNKLSAYKTDSGSVCSNKMSSVSTTCSFKGTDDKASQIWNEEQYLKLLNSFQSPECSYENSLPSSPKSCDEPAQERTEVSNFHSNEEEFDVPKFNNKKVVFRNNRLAHNFTGKSPYTKTYDEFTSVCEALSSYTSVVKPKYPTSRLDYALFSNNFTRHMKMCEDLIMNQPGKTFTDKLAYSRFNKEPVPQSYADTDSDSSSTILSTTSSNDSSYMDKAVNSEYPFRKETRKKEWIPKDDIKPRKKPRKAHEILQPEPPPTSLDKYLPTLNNYSKNSNLAGKHTQYKAEKHTEEARENKPLDKLTKNEVKTKEVDRNNENRKDKDIEMDKHSKSDKEKAKEKQKEYREGKEDRKEYEEKEKDGFELENGEEVEKNVLESLDMVGGVKYEPGSVDLRRKYKSFEQLCFGLGCIVAPTKQELEMCSQLSQLGDESTLSQYETSLYQSCLLRTRSFEAIWKKFCNRAIGIIRKYVLQGIYRLLSLIEFQNLVEPFLKVILLDLGTDRQDQQLFLNIVQEEMNVIIKEKFVLLKLNTSTSLTLDDIIEQMYIQLYRMTLLSSTKGLDFEGCLSFANVKNGVPDVSTKLESMKTGSGEDNLLDKLIKLYNKNFGDYELVVILDRLNPKLNDILYLLQMLNSRKLLPIKCIMVVCTNKEHLEKYCNSRIYSNLGIFDCNMINVTSVVDEIVQIVMYDSNVQDFLPNYRMLHEIFEMFYFKDRSLTLFVLRIYQLYEQYYNKYIFSYLSTVPSFVFDDQNNQKINEDMMTTTKSQLMNLNCDQSDNSKISRDPRRISSMLLSINANPDEKTEAKNKLEEFLLPKESFTKDKNNNDSSKMSDISTTTSLKSLATLSGLDQTPSSCSAQLDSNGSKLNSFSNDDKSSSFVSFDNESYDEDENDVDDHLYDKKEGSTKESRKKQTEKANEKEKNKDDEENNEEKENEQDSDQNKVRRSSRSRNKQDWELLFRRHSQRGTMRHLLNLSEKKPENREKEDEQETFERDTKENLERVDMAKRLYSIYSLLCISNNMSENHVAYLELMLGLQLDLEKIVLELLPLNIVILLQRRVLFQLGVNLLFRLMIFTPDSYNTRKRLSNLIESLPSFTARYDPKVKDDRDKPLKELIKRTLRYLVMRCSNPRNLERLKTIISSYNNVYKSTIEVVINIQTFLNWNCYDDSENQDALREMKYLLDKNMDPSELIYCIKNKLFFCFYPFINSYKLSNLLMLQGYTMIFRTEINAENNTSGSNTSGNRDSNSSSTDKTSTTTQNISKESKDKENKQTTSISQMNEDNKLLLNGLKNEMNTNSLSKNSSNKNRKNKRLNKTKTNNNSDSDSINELELSDLHVFDLLNEEDQKGVRGNSLEKLLHPELYSSSKKNTGIRITINNNINISYSYNSIISNTNSNTNSRNNNTININSNSSSTTTSSNSNNNSNTYNYIDTINSNININNNHNPYLYSDSKVSVNDKLNGDVNSDDSYSKDTDSDDNDNDTSNSSRDNNKNRKNTNKNTNTDLSLNSNGNYSKDTNYLMYIYRYVKYKMINMWKLFIIYYYLVTSNSSDRGGEKQLIEIYIRFNVNIELLEKIYKIILLNPTTNSTISSKETQGLLKDRSEDDDDIQLCYLIKNSLSNINVKFM